MKKKSENNSNSDIWDIPLETLRSKWLEVPAGIARKNTEELYNLSDNELIEFWEETKNEATAGDYFKVRGWYHLLYKDVLKNKKVMDVGSGLGIDGITFAKSGMNMTFVDIVESNLELLKRICSLFKLKNVEFLYLDEFDRLNDLPYDFDVIWCQGSMINLPFEIASEEAALLVQHLSTGGRWIELAYPEERWIQEGKMPFEQWGEKTDGGAPWMEWYDLDKLLQRLSPEKFDVVLSFNFHNDDFNWFDLVKI